MPPDHGAAIAAKIFAQPPLRREWIQELYAMRTRIHDMRSLLAKTLQEVTGDNAFDFIRTQHGMFSLLGVSRESVERLREKHHIYMTSDSRMNLAGIMPNNVTYVAEAFASERGT
jgi:aspartate aminotransferase